MTLDRLLKTVYKQRKASVEWVASGLPTSKLHLLGRDPGAGQRVLTVDLESARWLS